MKPDKLQARSARAAYANELIETIASCGRGFFNHTHGVSRFELDDRGRVWWIDGSSRRRVFLHTSDSSRWHGFTNGYTLRLLVQRLRDFIAKGKLLPGKYFEAAGPAGDYWGYGDDIAKVGAAAQRLGMLDEEVCQ